MISWWWLPLTFVCAVGFTVTALSFTVAAGRAEIYRELAYWEKTARDALRELGALQKKGTVES